MLDQKKLLNLLIFDLDGTLVDSSQDLASSVNHALGELGLNAVEPGLIISYVGDGIEKLLKRALTEAHRDRLKEALNLFRVHYGEHMLENTTLYPGVEEVLEHYSRFGKKMVVSTNKPEAFSRRILDSLGVSHFFNMVIGGDSTGLRKPHPEPIVKVLTGLKVEKERAVMVGDGVNDILSARAAGVWSCAVGYGFTDGEVLKGLNPDFLVESILDIIRYFI